MSADERPSRGKSDPDPRQPDPRPPDIQKDAQTDTPKDGGPRPTSKKLAWRDGRFGRAAGILTPNLLIWNQSL